MYRYIKSVLLSWKSVDNLLPIIFSIGAVLVLFLWQGYKDFSLWDEGFLWYGVQRVMAGEVPIRDFMAYDPGRYYFSAMLMFLWGDNGIIALRVVLSVFQAFGLYVALRLLDENKTKSIHLFLLPIAIILAVWMFPRHKLFDVSLSIVLIGVLSGLVDQPNNHRFFFTGLAIGIIAIFGRNHGLYGVVGSLGVMVYLSLGREENIGLIRSFRFWVSGVAVGYLPLLVMTTVIPGFAAAFWESILILFELKTTNLPLPVPWPWLIQFGQMPLIDMIRGVLTGFFFIGVFVFGLLGAIWVITQRLINKKPLPPLFVASAFLALPYAHFVYSRADIQHLAQGIFPLLIGAISLLANRSAWIKWTAVMVLAAASLLVMLPFHPGWQCQRGQQWVETAVAADTLIINPDTAGDLELLKTLVDDFASDGRGFISAPFWPGAYAALGKKSPMWEIYALFPASEAFQRTELERIKDACPAFAIVIDFPLDGRDELRFCNTHPLIDEYICKNFNAVTGYTDNQLYQIYKGK